MIKKLAMVLMALLFGWQICDAQINVVNEYNRIVLNDVEHGVFIKSNNFENPVLLVLHGGPGFSDFYFWQTHNKDLEHRYTVVTYDQRGTGLSYNDAIPLESMTFNQLENDALSLIQLLRERFKKDKIYLLGYSAGTIIGINLVKKHPSLFYAYVGVGQVTNLYLNEKISLRYSLQQAKLLKDSAAFAQLQELKKRYPSHSKNELADLYLSRKWLRYFHGDFCKGTNVGQLYKDMDKFAKKHFNDSLISKGQSFTMEAMWDEVMKVDLFKMAKELEIPVYFIAGRCDYNAPSILAFKYYKKLKAPFKKFIWFENSGHYAPFVEPDKFNRILLDEILFLEI